MEKKIRNAGKRIPPTNAVKGRRMSPLPKQSGNTRQTLPSLPIGTETIESKTKTLKEREAISASLHPSWPPPKVGTFDVAKDGIVTFYLVIPCATSSPDRKRPLYLVETNSLGGPENGVWQCQECGAIYHTRKAWAKHAGMISNIMGNCPGNGEQ